MMTPDMILGGYKFTCFRCGNDYPIRLAASFVGAKHLKCERCTTHVFTCSRCHGHGAECDKSAIKNLCLDCYGDVDHDSPEDNETRNDDDN